MEEETADYLWYADRFGWTPDQVDRLPAWLDARLPLLDQVMADVRAEMQEEATRG